MAVRHIVAWSPYFDSVDEALDHCHAGGTPVRVVLYRSTTGGLTGTFELEAPAVGTEEEEPDADRQG